MKQLSRAVELLGTAVTLILLAGIALVLLKANRTNDIVEAIRDAADWLAGPFNDMFELSSRRGSIAPAKDGELHLPAQIIDAVPRVELRQMIRPDEVNEVGFRQFAAEFVDRIHGVTGPLAVQFAKQVHH